MWHSSLATTSKAVSTENTHLDANKLEDGGNLQHNVDFRSAYTTLLDRWMGLDAKAITGGTFEPVPFL